MSERRNKRSPQAVLKPLYPLLALWALASFILWGLIGQDGIPREELLLDATSYGKLPWYAGIVSSLGILGWTTAVVAAAGGAWIARLAGRIPAASMLRGGCLLSLLLVLDDLFQLHVVVTKALGVGKAGFYLVYAVLSAWWGLSNHREVLRTRWALLVAACAALLGSAVVDQLWTGTVDALVLEDSLKFLGILAWAQYFSITSRDISASVARAASRTAGTSGEESTPDDGSSDPPGSGRRAVLSDL